MQKPDVAERERKIRDLRGQLSDLSAGMQDEIIFAQISPGRTPVTLYSLVDGEPVSVPEYMVGAALQKKLPDGGYMFTDNPDDAPRYRRGEVKCFLHPESPERAVVEEIGLGHVRCPAASLANEHSKRIHAQHRHHQEWAAYEQHIKDRKERQQEDRQQQQLEATLSIARAASELPESADEPPSPKQPRGQKGTV